MIITTTNGHAVNFVAEDIVDVTPDDDATPEDIPGILFVTGPGDVRVITASGEERTLTNFANDFSLLVSKVFETDTTATGIKLLK